jgi:hypothetical protein
MIKKAGLEKNIEEADLYSEIYSLIREIHGSWPAAGAFIGLTGGALSPLLGIILSLMAWNTTSESSKLLLSEWGTAFFMLSLPLYALGAHCLDLIESRSRPEFRLK